MMHTLRRRTQRDEEGFTLIELMVVVLIIAILLAIAIPTFLGARGKAQARGAQSNLRNALTAEKTVFTDNSQYSNDTSPNGALFSAEPSIQWVNKQASAVGQVAVTTFSGNNDNVELAAMDASGTKCWYVFDETRAPTNDNGAPAGTYYAFDNHSGTDNPCNPIDPPNGPVQPGPATQAATFGTTW